MKKDSSRITIPDVAEEAGVSTATAGRALGNYGYVSDEVRARVVETARRMGYRRNELARSLITGRTRTVGVVCADIGNPFFAGVVRGISDVLSSHDYQPIITNSDEDVATERDAVTVLMDKQVDGLIVAPAISDDASHLEAVLERGTKLVLVDRTWSGLSTDTVRANNARASRQAVGHLLELGHRRIGIVAELEDLGADDVLELCSGAPELPPHAVSPSAHRFGGYLAAHRDAGVEVDPELVLQTGEYDRELARDRVRRAMGADAPPTALFTVNSLMSEGTYACLVDLDMRTPTDVSLVAFDDVEWMRFVVPGITAVAQPVQALGRRAAEMLMQRLEEPDLDPRNEVLDAELVVRGSSAAPG